MTAVLTVGSSQASAECPKNAISHGVTAKIQEATVAMFQGLFTEALPTTIDVPSEEVTVFECPTGFDNTVVTPIDTVAHLKLRELQISLVPGAIVFDGLMDISVVGTLDMQLCAMSDAICDTDMQARGVRLHARIEPSIDACEPSMPITVFELTTNPYATEIALHECGNYTESWGLAYSWFRDTILETLTTEIDDAVREQLPAYVESLTTELINPSMDLEGLRLTTLAERIVVDTGSITVTYAADVQPIDGRADCLPAGASLPLELASSTPPILGDSLVSIGLSHAFTQRAIRASWLGGLMCFDSEDYGFDFSSSLEPFAKDVDVTALMRITTPPEIVLGIDGDEHGMLVRADKLEVDLLLKVPGYETSAIYVELGADLQGTIDIDPRLQALMVNVTDITSDGAEVHGTGTALVFSEAAMMGLIDNSIVPAFQESIGAIPIMSSIMVNPTVALRLEDVSTTPQHVRIDLDLLPVDSTDNLPPITLIDHLPNSPSPTSVEIEVASLDDTTPARFLRHIIAVDGVVDEGTHSGTTVQVDGLDAGHHEVSLQAVDLNGNVDATPVIVPLLIDTAPPTVVITSAPMGVTRSDSATIEFVASDDLTPADDIRLHYTVQTADPADAPTGTAGDACDNVECSILYLDLVAPGEAIELRNLPEDKVLMVTVIATDSVGNEGEAVVAFFSNPHPTLGCQGSQATAFSVMACAGLLFLGTRRRSTCRERRK